jgi:hypothetical protein
MGLVDKVGKVKVSERLPRLNDTKEPLFGDYVFKVEQVEHATPAGMDEFFKITGEIIESKGDKAAPAGERVAIVIFDDKYGYGTKDITYFTATISGMRPSLVKPEHVEELTGPEQPAEGATVRVSIQRKNDESDYPVMRFSKM